MIDIEWLREDEVLAVRPTGEIEEADFDAVGGLIDPAIARRGRLEGLLLDARGFAGWDDTRALVAHMRFVNAHVAKVARIAVVGDQWWLRAAPTMEVFTGTPVRVFGAGEAEAARAWLLESPPEPAALTFLPESAGDLVAIRIAGRLRDADYDTLKAELVRRLPDEGRLRMLVIVDEAFRGWTPRACLDDIAMAFAPWRHRLGRLAIVAGPGLVRWFAANFPAGLLPYPIEVFPPDEIDRAREWLAA